MTPGNMRLFFKDLSEGLSRAKSLQRLSVDQSHLMEVRGNLLQSVIEGCEKLQQLVIIDDGGSSQLKKFPLSEVSPLLKKRSLMFLYVRCQLLTNEDIKKLKTMARNVKKDERPQVVFSFTKSLEDPNTGFSVDDVKNIPAMYINGILSEETGIANLTFSDLF